LRSLCKALHLPAAVASIFHFAKQGLDQPARDVPHCNLLPGAGRPATAALGERAVGEACCNPISHNRVRPGAREYRSPHVCHSNGGRSSLAKTVAGTSHRLCDNHNRWSSENLSVCAHGTDVTRAAAGIFVGKRRGGRRGAGGWRLFSRGASEDGAEYSTRAAVLGICFRCTSSPGPHRAEGGQRCASRSCGARSRQGCEFCGAFPCDGRMVLPDGAVARLLCCPGAAAGAREDISPDRGCTHRRLFFNRLEHRISRNSSPLHAARASYYGTHEE